MIECDRSTVNETTDDIEMASYADTDPCVHLPTCRNLIPIPYEVLSEDGRISVEFRPGAYYLIRVNHNVYAAIAERTQMRQRVHHPIKAKRSRMKGKVQRSVWSVGRVRQLSRTDPTLNQLVRCSLPT